MYKIFDFLLESNIVLPELPEVEKGIASIYFQLLGTLPDKKQRD